MSPFTRQQRPLFIGVVHLPALPGSPHADAPLEAVLAHGVRDAQNLVDGGVDGLIVENLGDAPFTAGRVSAYTVAAMTRIALGIRDVAPDVLFGINVLRNDAHSALGIAAAVGADFIRINVHTGAMVTDQGLITGQARETLLERRRIGASVAIAADVLVKHAVPLGAQDLVTSARDTYGRGGADALIVTGTGTGQPIDLTRLEAVRSAVPTAPVWAGSGVTPDTLIALQPHVDGLIVGTYLHDDADLDAPVSVDRVRGLRQLIDS